GRRDGGVRARPRRADRDLRRARRRARRAVRRAPPYAEAARAAAAAEEEEEDEAGREKLLQLASVGRPHVGKPAIANRLLGEERLLTGPQAGITRDAIAVDWSWEGRPVRLVDTAGLRRKAHVEEKLEKLSTADTLRAIRLAEVVVLVLDATQGLEKQDLTIARM